MARKSGGPNKSLAIRTYKASHRKAKPKDVVAALEQEGIKVTPAFVSTVLSNARRHKGKKKLRGEGKGAGGKADNIAHLIQARRLAEKMGGIDAARQALDTLAKILG